MQKVEKRAVKKYLGDKEMMNGTPMQPPLNYRPQPSLAMQVRQAVLAQKLEDYYNLKETDEEADDFAVDDEFEPYSPHENENMPSIRELKKRAEEINKQIEHQKIERLKNKLEAETGRRGGGAAPADEPPEAAPEAAPSSPREEQEVKARQGVAKRILGL